MKINTCPLQAPEHVQVPKLKREILVETEQQMEASSGLLFLYKK